MRGGQRTGNLNGNFNRFIKFHVAAGEALMQRFAFDQFAGDVAIGIVGAHLVDRHDVWVVEPGDGTRFPLKSSQALLVVTKARGQDFERGSSPNVYVSCEIHLAHPAGADAFLHFVVTNRVTDQRVGLRVLN